MSRSEGVAEPGGVRIRVPARPENVHVVRAVAASVVAQSNIRIDELEDLRLAVDEACAYLVRSNPSARTLTVSFVPGPSSVSVAASVDGGSDPTSPSDGAEFLTWHLLGALTDGARLERGDAGPTIHFEKAFTT